ncbi:hypothetical protein GQ600_16241 [Phytophthora cactorum]|nr:hypothetical protein GQ600_16241 [Phytophthora cactorum]
MLQVLFHEIHRSDDAKHEPTHMGNDPGVTSGVGRHPGLTVPGIQQQEGFLFESHQAIHRFPWEVHEQVHNKHVLRSLKKQPYHKARKPLSKGIQAVIGTLEQATSVDAWTRGVQEQIPTQIWARDGMLTSFQVWVIYRMAVHQLNLHYPERQIQRKCGACKAPAPTPATKKKLKQLFGRWDQDLEKLHKQIWWALCSIIPAQLWMYRNKAVHHQGRISEQQQTEHIWASGLRQLRAIGQRPGCMAYPCKSVWNPWLKKIMHPIQAHHHPFARTPLYPRTNTVLLKRVQEAASIRLPSALSTAELT